VFASGEVVDVGAKDSETALLSLYYYTRALNKFGIPASVYNFEVNNVVGDFQIGRNINVDLWLEDHELSAQWDPERFKGLSYVLETQNDGPLSLVLFESGKCIITGGKSVEAVVHAYNAHVQEFGKYIVGEEYRIQNTKRARSRPWFEKKKTTKKKQLLRICTPTTTTTTLSE
jgi:TATA-box binding protein (TBP) (component of TFIID and TFIIIB)